MNWIEVEASRCLPRHVVQEFKVQARKSESIPSADGFAAKTKHGSGRRKGREARKEKEWHGTTAYPHHRRPIRHEFSTCTTAGTCDVRVLHADDGGW